MSKFNPRILVRIAAALQQPGENATGKVPLVRIFPIDGPRLVKAQCELRIICCADFARLAAGRISPTDSAN